MKGAIYARVARDDSGVSLERQIAEVQHYADGHMIDVVKVVSDTEAGTRAVAPSIDQMIADIEQGEYTHILMTELSRWSRRAEVGFENILRVKKAGGFLVFTRDGRLA